MGLWESQGKTWKMFITTVNRNPDAHSVCCCSVYKVLSYIMKSDKLLLTQWGFHRRFIGQKERRERTGPVAETCHIVAFVSYALSTEATKKLIQCQNECGCYKSYLPWSWNVLCRDLGCPCVIQTFPELRTTKSLYIWHFLLVKNLNLPGTAIKYFHCNCYIFSELVCLIEN